MLLIISPSADNPDASLSAIIEQSSLMRLSQTDPLLSPSSLSSASARKLLN